MYTLKNLLDADWNRLTTLAGSPQSQRKFFSHFSPRFLPVVLIRLASSLTYAGWGRIGNFCRFINLVFFGIEVPAKLSIGPGLVLPHTQGTVLGAASIGANVTIYHQVTLGASHVSFDYDLSQRPVVKDGVVIGVGAKVLGAVTIFNNAFIGANAVVVSDVPKDCTAVGIPARLIEKNH